MDHKKDWTVEPENRQAWRFVVRFRGGKPIARCESQADADRIAAALNNEKRDAAH